MSEEMRTLLAKEAIRDQIYTYCRALDRIDNELGYSVFAEDSKVKGDRAVSETYMYAACKFPGKDKPFTVEARCRDIDKWECRDGKWLIVERVVCGDNTFLIVPGRDFPNYNGERDNHEDPCYKFFEEFDKGSME